jgi:SAM-dependent methyltransferase
MTRIIPADKGWFAVPGIRPKGDRTLEEQMMGLEPARAFSKGKSVLDLGCAEGLIALEFSKAGAERVVGVELLESHLAVARKVCAGRAGMQFHCAHLDEWAAGHPQPEAFDVVLALGIIHKLHDPAVPLRFAAASARSLLCFRAPAPTSKSHAGDYVVKSKFTHHAVNVPETMRSMGFSEGETIAGVRGEAVQYWWRVDGIALRNGETLKLTSTVVEPNK